jgi:hypothetical protein
VGGFVSSAVICGEVETESLRLALRGGGSDCIKDLYWSTRIIEPFALSHWLTAMPIILPGWLTAPSVTYTFSQPKTLGSEIPLPTI